MGEAASALSDLAIVTSDNPRTEDPLAIIREIEAGIRTRRNSPTAGDWLSHPGEQGYLVVPDRREAIAAAIGLAGSRRHRPDRREGPRGLPDHRHTEVPLRRPGDRPGRAGAVASREGRIMTDDAPILSAEEILKATGGTPLRGGTDWSCRGISTDTRTLRPGNLFIALAGENFDGHDCLAAAAQKGAAGLLIRAESFGKAGRPAKGAAGHRRPGHPAGAGGNRPRLAAAVPDPARRDHGSFRERPRPRRWSRRSPPRSRSVLKTEGNLNNLIGLPLTLLGLQGGARTRHRRDGDEPPRRDRALAAIAAPDVGLITNIGPAHLEGLGSLEAIREEKGALFEVMAGRGTAIINHDDPAIARPRGALAGKARHLRPRPGRGSSPPGRSRPAGPGGGPLRPRHRRDRHPGFPARPRPAQRHERPGGGRRRLGAGFRPA